MVTGGSGGETAPSPSGETTLPGEALRPPESELDARGPSEPMNAVGPASATLSAGTPYSSRPGDPDRLLERGDAVGRYLVVQMLGRGGMGVVYRAYDPDLDRAIALKMCRVDAASDSASARERGRLLREAQAMARLSHPNVITVHDVGILEGSVYVAMEYVEGSTLRAWLTEGRRSWREILDAFLQAGRGIAAAHAADIVHRDFKPDNVMIGRDPSSQPSSVGRVRVLDFGLARSTGQVDPSQGTSTEQLRTHDSVSLDRSLTLEGAILGTPAYMSPEQHVGAKVGPASDQFSFCVALFEALHGERPFAGDNLVSLAYAVTQGELREPKAGHDVPRFVHEAVVRGLSTKAAERFPSMDALMAALSRDPRRTRRRWAIAGGSACLLVGGLLAADHGAPKSELCTGAQDRLRPVWNEDRRVELERAFADTRVPFAEDTWRRVSTVLDDRAGAWVDSHTRACRATRIVGDQSEAMLDLRMACLDRQLRELDALLDRFGEADVDVVERSIDAIGRMGNVASCDDTTSLGTRAGPPSDPRLARAVEAREKDLAEVSARLRLGDYQGANERIAAVAEEALALEHAPLSARLLMLQATAESGTGETRPAVETYQRALEQALESGDDKLSVDIARELSWVVGYRLAEHDRGHRELGIARALLRRTGGDAESEAALATTEGAILVAAGSYDEGIAAHARARDYWEKRDANHPSLARALDSIGAAEIQRGRPDSAVLLHRRALEIKRAHYGETHPAVAATQRELANALGHTGAFEEALATQREVLAIERQARGEKNERVATALDDMGRSLRNLDRLDDAVEHHRRALEIWKQVLGDPHPSLAVSMLNIGYTLNKTGDFEAALAEFERALATVLSSVGPEHPYAVYAHNASASALVDLDRPGEALSHVEAVLALENLQVDPTLVAESKFIGAHALWPGAQPPAAQRARARRLALEAREAYGADADRWASYIEKIDAWLRDHPA